MYQIVSTGNIYEMVVGFMYWPDVQGIPPRTLMLLSKPQPVYLFKTIYKLVRYRTGFPISQLFQWKFACRLNPLTFKL